MRACVSPCMQLDRGKFSLCPEAVRILQDVGEPLAVVCVAGLARTGKSFLLNQLLNRKKGFEVASRVGSCTRGLWMWSELALVRTPDGDVFRCLLMDTGLPPLLLVFFVCLAGLIVWMHCTMIKALKVHVPTPDVDLSLPKHASSGMCTSFVVVVTTEGLGSIEADMGHDSQIFTLAVLLSSLLVYNSKGTIDEGAIDRLALRLVPPSPCPFLTSARLFLPSSQTLSPGARMLVFWRMVSDLMLCILVSFCATVLCKAFEGFIPLRRVPVFVATAIRTDLALELRLNLPWFPCPVAV